MKCEDKNEWMNKMINNVSIQEKKDERMKEWKNERLIGGKDERKYEMKYEWKDERKNE